MVVDGYSDWGEEWAQKWAWRQDLLGTRDTTAQVLLYDDSTDQIGESDDLGAVTTEPTDGNYTQQVFSLDDPKVSLTVVDGKIQAEAEVTFDVTNTTGTIDSSMTTITFQSDIVNSESSQNPHHITSATAGTGSRNLSDFTEITVTVRLTLN